ncbi:MAG TPA: hypothetical protein VGG16_13320 [Streptosporangiaceae bacterium]|jgi:hypothetical protein
MIRRAARRIVHRVSRTVADLNYAQRRLVALASAADRWVPERAKAPDTFAEFMFRTSGPLLHEPSARRRDRGRRVG